MTPLQAAEKYCDNFQNDGSCLGAMIGDDLVIRRCIPRPKCLLGLDLIRRCQHFEECIAPRKLDHKIPKLAAKLQTDFSEAVRTYRHSTGALISENRMCPICKKTPILPGYRMCPNCRIENRTKTFRKANSSKALNGTTVS